ncbi:MAG: hypothetical protein A2406_02800 [Candidatus Komeilibacteria bacterium RIFOXYC1_FULL_37_11]|uniref:LamG-like jellyroll fold domain-containing protein n=1 Tax=Candidatus Komeilibacteria bacterium RIFOXYC1_FULL_37_11 TaxID=1798555 RepID=A0A1G2BX76_9BACT|nr:MAG: hypothetical protein A2406_02800 [Candidatus Komeilibacteria bacterium RIFOXYC1_FULL_37_11]
MTLNKKGFSLVEAIIYLAIVGILLTAVISLHLTLGGTSSKLVNNILASRNRRVSMGAMNYLVKNSDGLLKDLSGDCSSFGATPPVLALYFEDDNHLPGTCVESGGGVRIAVADKKISLTCYPNMSGNGYYQNCSTSVYPAGNVYYLSSDDVAVLNNSLAFSTSTSSSTANNFLALTTHLSVGTFAGQQARLTATSTATSTVILRNEEASGLISWYKMDASPGYTVDSKGPNNLQCAGGSGVTGLINGSTNAFDFEASSGDPACFDVSPQSFYFNNAFTITAWVKEESSGVDRQILGISDYTNRGYSFYIDNAYPMLRIGDSSTYTDYNGTGTAMTTATVYNVAATYDLNNNKIVLYVYQNGIGGVATTTFTTAATLTNSYSSLFISDDASETAGTDENFDGVIDEVRVYNRALTPQEIWAIQSQGAP